jgi:hypothetical protein
MYRLDYIISRWWLLDCNTMYFRDSLTLKKSLACCPLLLVFAWPTLQSWRWWYVPPKCWAVSELHGVTAQKTVLFIYWLLAGFSPWRDRPVGICCKQSGNRAGSSLSMSVYPCQLLFPQCSTLLPIIQDWYNRSACSLNTKGHNHKKAHIHVITVYGKTSFPLFTFFTAILICDIFNCYTHTNNDKCKLA